MKTTKALIASLGTSALLVACALTMLVVVGAVLAFKGFPEPTLETSTRTLVVGPALARQDEVVISRREVESAEAAAVASSDPTAEPVAASPTPSPGGSTPAVPPGAAPSAPVLEPAPEDPAGGGGGGGSGGGVLDDLPGGRQVQDTVGGIGREVEETVGGVGRTGRDLTNRVSDDVVSRVSPRLGGAVKRSTEPVWRLLDDQR